MSNRNKVLVAGATGMLGQHIWSQLLARSESAKALVRQPKAIFGDVVIGDLRSAESLRGCCDDIRTVISCAGASMSLGRRKERASFPDVDHKGNRNLLAEAKRAGVKKFIYVSLNPAGLADSTIYVQSHERFVDELRTAGLAYTVIRPSGFFGFYAQAFAQAKRGRALVIGSGTAKTNPIHEAEAARACVEAIIDSRTEIAVGGPEVFSRLEAAELALRVAGRPGSPRHVPAWAFRAILPLLRIADPRIHALFEFGIEVSLNDCVAPSYGTERLGDYLRSAFVASS